MGIPFPKRRNRIQLGGNMEVQAAALHAVDAPLVVEPLELAAQQRGEVLVAMGAAGIWSQDTARASRIAQRIEAGTVYINTYFGSAPQSPVGGFKQSGYGRENGIEGLRAFQQTRSVWLSTAPDQPDPFGA